MDQNIERGQPALDDAEAILESITDAFFSLGSDWKFTYVNYQAQKVRTDRPDWENFVGGLPRRGGQRIREDVPPGSR